MEDRSLPSLVCERAVSLKYSYGHFPKFVIDLDPQFHFKKTDSEEVVKQLEIQFSIKEEPNQTYFKLNCLNGEFGADWNKINVLIHSTHWLQYIDKRWTEPERFKQKISFFDTAYYTTGNFLYLDFKITITKLTVSLIQPRLNFQELFLNRRFSDFTLICKGNDERVHEIPVHRILLYQASPYFKGLFTAMSNYIENEKGYVIQSVNFASVYEILYYIYTGELSDSVDDAISETMAAADYFLMDELKNVLLERCKHCMNEGNVQNILETALMNKVEILAKNAFGYIKKMLDKEKQELIFGEICDKLPCQFAKLMASMD
uniref:BTB domain-containing protein n=1 Tax=Bursaphelenchus xylophilus TaxID=6326 RepID=A0A1I7RKD2_BURXY